MVGLLPCTLALDLDFLIFELALRGLNGVLNGVAIVSVHRVLHTHLGVLEKHVEVIELVELVGCGRLIKLILLAVLRVLNRAVAEGVGLVLVLIPLRYFVLHFEAHGRLLL